jgi:hypothetical protein
VEEAVLHARRAVRWTDGKDAKMLLTLADAYAAAKLPEDARMTLKRAVTAAEASSPDLLPTLRARLGTLR